MRDYLVIAIIVIFAPIALIKPYFGVLLWTWISYFNPHRYGWAAAKTFPVAMIIGIPTLVGALCVRKNSSILGREAIMLALLWLWFTFTTFYIAGVPQLAGHSLDARDQLIEVSKILLMTFVTILLVTSKERLRTLVLVILISFGVRALFGAFFFLTTGGQYRIWGPDGTFLADNNDFALALNMTLPLFFFQARSEKSKWLRVVLRVLMVCVAVCVIGTYSRGGLLGLAVVAAFIWLKSRQKIVSGGLVVVAVLLVLSFSSAAWKERMDDFSHGHLDESAQSRLDTWAAGWKLAMDYPVTGGGFGVYVDGAALTPYLPATDTDPSLHGPHSIYFQMLGEQGFIGVTGFIVLLVMCLLTTRSIRARAKRHQELEWAVPYADMFEISLVAYMVNGATLGRAYFDFSYQVIACVILLKILYRNALSDLVTKVISAEPIAEPVPV